MIWIREDILSKLLDKHLFSYDVEGLFVELNFRKCKCQLFGTYHQPFHADIYYFDNLDKAFDTYSDYEKRLPVGYFNTEISEPRIESLLYEHELQNLVKDKTCFKSIYKPSINLLLKNSAMAFQNTSTVFTGLLDFHNLVLTVLKIVSIKSYLQKLLIESIKVLAIEKIKSCTKFDEIFLQINKHAPLSSKFLRANHASHISKPLRKPTMKRSYLENLHFKKRTQKALNKLQKPKIYCRRLLCRIINYFGKQ